MEEKEKEKEVEVNAIIKDNNKYNNMNAQSIVSSYNTGLIISEVEMKELEVFLKRYITSAKSGITSVADGIAIAMRARDLRLPFSTCVEHIHVVNGKTGLDVHIIKSLLIKGSVSWECTKDYHALYEYTDGYSVFNENELPNDVIKCKSPKDALEKAEKDIDHDKIYVYPVRYYQGFDGVIYKEYQFNDKFAVAISIAHANKLKTEGKFPVMRITSRPIDYITEYTFYRNIGGKEIKSVSSFSYSDAVLAGCFEKDTYKKYPKVMIGHRAFIYGARDIADDLIMGCMSIEELKLMNNQELTNDDVIDITSIQ